MSIRHTLILVISIASLLSACTTPSDEVRLEKLMRHRSWPRIQEIAKEEVRKREKALGWPDTASYLPAEHKDKVWVVMAMTGTPNGDVQRVITLMISDDGEVLEYKRHGEEAR